MDKYQKNIFDQIDFRLLAVVSEDKRISGNVKKEEDKLVIYQDKDITIKEYHLPVANDVSFLKLSYYANKKWNQFAPFKYNDKCIAGTFNFDNPITKIRVEHINGIFEPFEIEVINNLASVEEYNKTVAEENAKKESERLAELAKQINPQCKTGQDLVNIYWDIVNSNVKKVEVNLYMSDNNQVRKIVSHTEKTDVTFKSITGLARGHYLYEIIQLDGKGNLVAKTDRIKFSIGISSSGVVFGR